MTAIGSAVFPIRFREHFVDCPACDGDGTDSESESYCEFVGMALPNDCEDCDGSGLVDCDPQQCDCHLTCEWCGSMAVELDLGTGIVTCRHCRRSNAKPESEKVRMYVSGRIA